MNKQIFGVPSQAVLIDGRSDVQQVKVQVRGRWFRSLPALAGISYAITWVAGLAAWPSNLAIDASRRRSSLCMRRTGAKRRPSTYWSKGLLAYSLE